MKIGDYLKVGGFVVGFIVLIVGMQWQIKGLREDVDEGVELNAALEQDIEKLEDEIDAEQRHSRERLAAHDTQIGLQRGDLKHIADSLDDLNGLIRDLLPTMQGKYNQDRG